MKILSYQSEEEWLEDRKARIMGTKLKDIILTRGTEEKDGFWQLIADVLADDSDEDDDESPMDRGHRLESLAAELLSKETGIEFIHTNNEIWESDVDSRIATSPDAKNADQTAVMKVVRVLKEGAIGAEFKALKSAHHIKAFVTQKVPKEHRFQALQPFIVNKQLEQLYFAFIDPRVKVRPFFYILINRSDVQGDVEKYEKYQLNKLAEVDEIVAQLAF